MRVVIGIHRRASKGVGIPAAGATGPTHLSDRPPPMDMPLHLFTVGHSTHAIEPFIELLQAHGIEVLADIRRFPGSRKHPQFNRESLEAALRAAGIRYVWIEGLGGRRPKRTDFDSPNAGWRNDSFRNYADYMLTGEFRNAMDELEATARQNRTAMMCSESLFWRCHRRLVSDDVVARGGTVEHIFPGGETRPHALTAGAQVDAGVVTYPGEKTLFD